MIIVQDNKGGTVINITYGVWFYGCNKGISTSKLDGEYYKSY